MLFPLLKALRGMACFHSPPRALATHLPTHYPPTPPTTHRQAYLSVAPNVACFPEYFEPLAWHLLRSKLRHWEKSLRELAAQALAGVCSCAGYGGG